MCKIKSKMHRSVICKLLARCLKLQIEVDRYRGIDLDGRYCKLCECNLVEGNSQFLWQCIKLSSESEPLLKYLDIENEPTDTKCKHFCEKLEDKIDKEVCKMWIARNHKLYKRRQISKSMYVYHSLILERIRLRPLYIQCLHVIATINDRKILSVYLSVCLSHDIR